MCVAPPLFSRPLRTTQGLVSQVPIAPAHVRSKFRIGRKSSPPTRASQTTPPPWVSNTPGLGDWPLGHVATQGLNSSLCWPWPYSRAPTAGPHARKSEMVCASLVIICLLTAAGGGPGPAHAVRDTPGVDRPARRQGRRKDKRCPESHRVQHRDNRR